MTIRPFDNNKTHLLMRMSPENTVALPNLDGRFRDAVLGGVVNNIYAGATQLIDAGLRSFDLQTPMVRIQDDMRNSIATVLKPRTISLRNSITSIAEKNNAARKSMLDVEANPMMHALAMQALQGKSLNQRIQLAHTDTMYASTLLQFWSALDMPANMRPEIERSLGKAALVRKFATTAAKSKPDAWLTGDNEPNYELAEQLATAAIADLDAVDTDLNAARDYARNVVQFAAMATGTPSAIMQGQLFSEAA